jgi:hypothetical protein
VIETSSVFEIGSCAFIFIYMYEDMTKCHTQNMRSLRPWPWTTRSNNLFFIEQLSYFVCVYIKTWRSSVQKWGHYALDLWLQGQITAHFILQFVLRRTILSQGQVPSYFVCICIRTWWSVSYLNEITVTLTFDLKVNLYILYVYVLEHDSVSYKNEVAVTICSNNWFFMTYGLM